MQHAFKPGPLSIFTLALATQLAQAGTPPSLVDIELAGYPASGFAGGGHFEKLAVLDCDQDGGLDAIVLDGGYLVISYSIESITAPTIIQTPMDVDLIVNDFAVLKGTTTSGGCDAVATVGYEGLEVYEWNQTTLAFKRQYIEGGAFLGASQVRSADWDGDGLPDILVLNDTRTEVDILLGNGGTQWTSATTFTFPLPVVDFFPIQWNADSELELAVIDTAGLSVWETGLAAPIYYRGSPLAPGKIARIEGSNSIDHLAWLVGPLGDGNHYLAELDSEHGLFDVMPIVDGTPVSMSSGDYDGDADGDLGITFKSSHDILIIAREETEFGAYPPEQGGLHLLSAGPIEAPVGELNTAPVSFADLDFDGLPDLIFPSRSLADIALLHNHTKQYGDPAIESAFQSFGSDSFEACLNTDGSGAIQASLTQDLPPEITDVEITVWLEPLTPGAVQQDAFANCLIPITGANKAGPFDFVIPSSFVEDSNSITHIMLRPLNQGSLSAPSIHCAYSFSQSNLNSMESAPGWQGSVGLTFPSCTPAQLPQGTPIGGIKGTRRINPYGSGKRPKPDAPCPAPPTPPAPQ